MNKKTADFLSKSFDALETIIILLLLTALIITYNEVSWGIYGLYATLGLLALLYFLMSLRPFDTKVAGIRIIIRRFLYISYVFSTLSIMSTFSFDDNVDTKKLVIASLCFLGVSVILLLLRKYKMKETSGFVPNITRCVIFALILSWLLIMFNIK